MNHLARAILLFLIFAQCFLVRATILDVIASDQRFSSFYQQVDHFVRIKEILSNTSVQLTVIAPTNEAYLSFDFANLENKLKYLLLDGLYDVPSLVDGTLLNTFSPESSLKTQQRIRLTSNSSGVFLGQAKISVAPIQSDNGQIYPVQAVPELPSTISVELENNPSFTNFSSLLKKSSLGQDYDAAPKTLFAPSDKAFSADDDLLNYLISQQVNQADLQTFLQYHISPALQYIENLNFNGTLELPTFVSNSSLVLVNSSGNVSVSGIPIAYPNWPARNGVIHALSGYLIPPALAGRLTLRQLLIARKYTQFVEALDAVGEGSFLDEITGNRTIFVPPLTTLENLNEKLSSANVTVKQLLSYHVSDRLISYEDTSSQKFYPSRLELDGVPQQLNITIAGEIGNYCGNVRIKTSNILASNGIVHFLEDILTVPPRVRDWLATQSEFSHFARLVDFTQISFPASGGFSLLLPVDAAFDSLPDFGKHLVNINSSTTPLPQLIEAVSHHIIPGDALISSEIDPNTNYRTLNQNQDDIVTFFFYGNNNSEIYLNNSYGVGAKIIRRDILVREGVVQVLDSVLLERPDFDQLINNTLAHLGLTTFSFALERVGLLSLLGIDDQFVVFAPTNAALDAANVTSISQEDLEKRLRYHIVQGATFDIEQFTDPVLLLPSILTVDAIGGRQQLRIAKWGTKVTVNSNVLLNPHISMGNGVVYVIENLIPFPQNITNLLSTHSNFTNFGSLVVDFDGMIPFFNSSTLSTPSLQTTLIHTRKLTAFVPTNDAWKSVPSDLQSYLLLEDDLGAFKDLAQVLLYHLDQEQDVNQGPKYSNVIEGRTELVSLNGETLVVEISPSSANSSTKGSYHGYDIVLNDNKAKTVLPDIIVENGVVHGINNVLLPPSFRFTLEKSLKGMKARIFLEAIRLAALDDMLTGDQNYTLFAPSDVAFLEVEDLTEEIEGNTSISADAEVRLADLIRLHVVKGNIEKIKAGEMYTPLLPNYVLIGGKDGKSIHMMNLTYYSSGSSMKTTRVAARGLDEGEDDIEDDIEKDKEIKKDDNDDEEGILTSTGTHNATSGFAFTNEGKIESISRTSNGIIYEIDIVFVPDTVSDTRSYGWLIFVVAVIVLITVGLIGYYFYRRRQALADVRLLD